jgi:tetratricopeptide (TPR) repeat protein/O-antigen ligase
MERFKNVSPILYFVLVLTVLAPFLGGSGHLWAQAVIALSTGVLLLLFPPKNSLGLVPNVAFVTLFALSLTAFLPAWWSPQWRADLVKLGADLPATISPQPWLTFQGVCLLLLQLSWAYYVLACDWTFPDRRRGWSLFGAAIVALAALLTVCFTLHLRIPFWPHAPEYGFFSNRNHTSNVLALGGILVYALAMRGFDEGRRNWWLWLAALSLICWALILNYSRAGIVLLGAGIVAWHLYWSITSEHKRRPLIASGAILFLIALFVWNGGKTAMRFGQETAQFFFPSENMRLAIYRDTLQLSAEAPLTGVGLRNFSPIFTTKPHPFIGEGVAGHPESDWLWTTVEMGWIAPLLILLLITWWMTRCFPVVPGTFRLMRMAAFICGCGFLVHSFFDVPAHQIGALWPPLFLASTALNPQSRHRSSRVIVQIFRTIGCLFFAFSLWWFASVFGAEFPPTDTTVRQLTDQADAASANDDYEGMLRLASKAVSIAPLNWESYFQRGFAEAVTYRPRVDAVRDFAIARYLLPNWQELYLKEGQTWLGVGEADNAFDVWKEGIRRIGPPGAHLYGQIFDLVKSDPDLRDRWRLLGRDNKKCLVVFFQQASPVELRVELDRLLADDPELKVFDAKEKLTLFEAWFHNGDKLELAEALREQADWRVIGWKQLALTYAQYGDYQNACLTAREFASIPPVPNPPARLSSANLELQARLHPTDIDTAAALCLVLAKEDRVEQALARLQALHELKGYPDYLRNLEAKLWERKGEWGKAWNALRPFVL